jgi:NAD(P)-dependent dehydrogenase (short-subunit alcohol dehydrogenase family)
MCLDGKIIVVTDGPAGLELAIARELARNGATVIITFMNRSEFEKSLSFDENCYRFQLNVSKKRSPVKFIENFSFSTGNTIILDWVK